MISPIGMNCSIGLIVVFERNRSGANMDSPCQAGSGDDAFLDAFRCSMK